MRFYEHEAREIARRAGIPILNGGFAADPAGAAQIAERLGCPVVVASSARTAPPCGRCPSSRRGG
jgi:succinyl-CoA synthetase beta subunit